MNRGHIIGAHEARWQGEQRLLVRAVDAIPGMHNVEILVDAGIFTRDERGVWRTTRSCQASSMRCQSVALM